MPYRGAAAAEPELFTGSDKADRLLQKKLLANLQRSNVPAPSAPAVIGAGDGAAAAPPSLDATLLSAMADRLARLECENRELREHAALRETLNAGLKRRVAELQAASGLAERVSELRAENARLARQIGAMEAFLNDYGMVWVGEDSGDEADDDAQASAPPVAAQQHQHQHMRETVPVLQARIAELNAIAGDGISSVTHDARGAARLEAPRALVLTVFANGFTLDSAPERFRSLAGEPAAVQFLADILDGYFPSELRAQHPAGVPFALVDRSSEWRESGVAAFAGPGRTLDGRVAVLPQASADGVAPVRRTVADFLAALPASVVRGGVLVPVRSDVASLLGAAGESACATAAGTTVVAVTETLSQLAAESGGAARPRTPRDVASLHVRFAGHATLLLKLRYGDTLADVCRFVASHLGGLARQRFEVRSNFPARVFTDDSQTLADAGLVPNATLHVRVIG